MKGHVDVGLHENFSILNKKLKIDLILKNNNTINVYTQIQLRASAGLRPDEKTECA